MFAVKVLGKIIAIPMILVMTVLFYIVTIFSRIYGLAATVFNLVIMLCAIIALVLQQWNNLGIAVAILVISYLLMVLGILWQHSLQVLRSFLQEYYLHSL